MEICDSNGKPYSQIKKESVINNLRFLEINLISVRAIVEDLWKEDCKKGGLMVPSPIGIVRGALQTMDNNLQEIKKNISL